MSEVEGTEELNDENTVKAPAEELVELILTGELHAANQKFNSIIEDKVIESIEEEKHKISQTLFAEDDKDVDDDDDDDDDGDDKVKKDDEEDEDDSPVGKADEGKIPPQFLKGKDKDDEEEDEDDSPVGDDDDSDDDDSDSDDDDDDDDGKSKKGKVPPQFMKKEDMSAFDKDDDFQRRRLAADKERHKEAQSKGYADYMHMQQGKKSTVQRVKNAVGSLVNKATGNKNEGVTGDPEANEKAIAKNREMAKKYGQVRQGIPPEKEKKEEVEHSFDPGEASANVELPKDSFVQQVADNLAGKRR